MTKFYEQIYVPEHENQVCYIAENKWNKFVSALQKMCNENNSKEFENEFIKAGKRFETFGKKIAKQNLKTKSNNFLKKIYQDYQRLAAHYTFYIWAVYLLNNFFSEKAKEVIHKNIKEKKEEHAFFEAVFTPEKKAAILEFTSIIHNTPTISKSLMQKLHSKFQWVPCLDIHNPPWTLKEFKNHIRQMQKKNQKPVMAFKELLKKLPLTGQEKKILEAAKRFAYLKDLRDDFRRKTVWLAQISLFKEIARRMQLKVHQLSYLQEREIINFLDRSVKPESFKDRQKGFVVFFNSFKVLACASGNEIKQTMRKLGLSSREDYLTEIKGTSASKGIAEGKVVIVKGVKDLPKVKKGNILVAVTTHPDYVPVMQKAAAIVTDEGGITSHAAIVARELGVPCIVGTHTASKKLKDGDKVEVDANIGLVRKLA